jgi:hypothetical protein
MCLKYVEIGETVILFPDFYHDFGLNNESEKPSEHTFSGSFLRHRTIERALLKLKELLLDVVGDACPAYTILNASLGIFLGLNCGFPKRDVALYFVWVLGFYKPFIFHGKRWGVFAISDHTKLSKQEIEALIRRKFGRESKIRMEQI